MVVLQCSSPANWHPRTIAKAKANGETLAAVAQWRHEFDSRQEAVAYAESVRLRIPTVSITFLETSLEAGAP